MNLKGLTCYLEKTTRARFPRRKFTISQGPRWTNIRATTCPVSISLSSPSMKVWTIGFQKYSVQTSSLSDKSNGTFKKSSWGILSRIVWQRNLTSLSILTNHRKWISTRKRYTASKRSMTRRDISTARRILYSVRIRCREVLLNKLLLLRALLTSGRGHRSCWHPWTCRMGLLLPTQCFYRRPLWIKRLIRSMNRSETETWSNQPHSLRLNQWW